MRILLSNDDGFQAPGIRVLADILAQRGHEIFVVAPNEEKSGNSHAMSFFTPLLVKRISEKIFSVHGTPADCVSLALAEILQNQPPDLVISGINNGFNVGRDVNYSGTVGAATEAALEGYRAIAVSMDRVSLSNECQAHAAFERVAHFTADIVASIDDITWPAQEVLNINHPASQPHSIRMAECNSTSLYDPVIDKLQPASVAAANLRIYMIGGGKRTEFPENSEDVSLVNAGHAVLSFLQCRQSSTEHTRRLGGLIQRLTEKK